MKKKKKIAPEALILSNTSPGEATYFPYDMGFNTTAYHISKNYLKLSASLS